MLDGRIQTQDVDAASAQMTEVSPLQTYPDCLSCGRSKQVGVADRKNFAAPRPGTRTSVHLAASYVNLTAGFQASRRLAEGFWRLFRYHRLQQRVDTRLATAERIRLYGFRNSHFLASYLAASLAQFRQGVAKLMPQGQTAAEGLAEIGAKDVVFIVGFRRRPANFTQIVRSSISTGACVILLTDPSIRVIPAGIEYTIICPVESSQLLDAYGGALVILRTLALKAAAALDHEGRRYLEKLESLRSALDELE